ncbi:hypothetical protein JCM11641_006322 [Rhodosporidiobolus odoratus]
MTSKRSASPLGSDSPPAKRPRFIAPLEDNPLNFPRKEPRDTVQISTWNVAGLMTCNSEKWQYGFRLYVEAEDPHVLAITEVNEQDAHTTFETDSSFDFLRARYPYRYWAYRTAIVSKYPPIGPAVHGFPDGTRFDKVEAAGRAITVEYKEFYLICTYVPNSGGEFKRLDKRKQWADDFEPYIRALDAKKPVVWCGDFNVIRTTTPTSNVTNDLQWPQNFGRYPGTHKVERDAHERLLGVQEELKNPRRSGRKFVDVWRLIYGKDARQYTHSSKKLGGWRIDGFICSERFLPNIRKCEIRYEIKRKFWPEKDVVGKGALSDHWPVWLSLEMEDL